MSIEQEREEAKKRFREAKTTEERYDIFLDAAKRKLWPKCRGEYCRFDSEGRIEAVCIAGLALVLNGIITDDSYEEDYEADVAKISSDGWMKMIGFNPFDYKDGEDGYLSLVSLNDEWRKGTITLGKLAEIAGERYLGRQPSS